MKLKKEWSLYIIEAENGFLYTGITKDLERRFEEHKSSDKSAKFLEVRLPKKWCLAKKDSRTRMRLKKNIESKN